MYLMLSAIHVHRNNPSKFDMHGQSVEFQNNFLVEFCFWHNTVLNISHPFSGRYLYHALYLSDFCPLLSELLAFSGEIKPNTFCIIA